MEYAKTFVFKEINVNDTILFLWYKLAEHQIDNTYIVPDRLLTYEEHQKALSYA